METGPRVISQRMLSPTHRESHVDTDLWDGGDCGHQVVRRRLLCVQSRWLADDCWLLAARSAVKSP